MKKLISIILISICLGANAQNESESNHSLKYLSVEIDPAPFILGGYSFSLKVGPEKLPHLSFMGSVFSSKFPDKMMSESNYEKGFRNEEMKTSYAIFIDYFIRNDRSGFHFGPSVFYYSKSVESNFSTDDASYNSVYPNVRIGYVYKPFKKSGFYLNPWFNFGKEIVLGDGNSIEGQEFLINKSTYIVAIHLGYQIR